MQYRVISPIRHDGDIYHPDEIVDFFGDQEARLLLAGAIQPVDMPFAHQAQATAAEEPNLMQAKNFGGA